LPYSHPKPEHLSLNRLEVAQVRDHTFIGANDAIFFLGEYLSGMGFGASSMNSHIVNIKRKPSECAARAEFGYYKDKSIKEIARRLTDAVNPMLLEGVSFVPVPPSRGKQDPEYDDRLVRILAQFHAGNKNKHVCEFLAQRETIRASHKSVGDRPTVDELTQAMTVDETLAGSLRPTIAIFDDILTTGRHFRAAQALISKYRPDARFMGLFIARVRRGNTI